MIDSQAARDMRQDLLSFAGFGRRRVDLDAKQSIRQSFDDLALDLDGFLITNGSILPEIVRSGLFLQT